MDKISRVLELYRLLESGEHFSKEEFCLGRNVPDRSFDRDLKDVRLFLQDIHSNQEVIYDRQEHCYYMTHCQHGKFDATEWLTMEKLLLGSNILNRAESEGLLKDLLSVTTSDTSLLYPQLRADLEKLTSESENKALLKLIHDLQRCILKQLSISLTLQTSNEFFEALQPLEIRFDGEKFILIVQNDMDKPVKPIPLALIDSFTIV